MGIRLELLHIWILYRRATVGPMIPLSRPYRRMENICLAAGTADDKAPAMVGLYAMRFLKEHGIKLKNDIMLVFGLNEEKGSADMPEFLKRGKSAEMVFGTGFQISGGTCGNRFYPGEVCHSGLGR